MESDQTFITHFYNIFYERDGAAQAHEPKYNSYFSTAELEWISIKRKH